MLRYFLNLLYTTITKDTLGVLILFGPWSIPIKAICIWMLWRAEFLLEIAYINGSLLLLIQTFFRLLLIKCKQPKSLIAAPQSTCIQMKFSVRVFLMSSWTDFELEFSYKPGHYFLSAIMSCWLAPGGEIIMLWRSYLDCHVWYKSSEMMF